MLPAICGKLTTTYGRKWKVADVAVDLTGKYSIRYGYEYDRLTAAGSA
ncbi:MAG TPA: hypothetical protein VG815_08000 [Chloroflexota bacterium]|jgi:hypothetical protein|nr:hypothetical protein [Chloroflexota bacterium]